MFTVLQAHHLPDEEVRLHAALHRAGLRRPPASDIDPDAGLFTAQHGIDKALVRDGRFCTIEDYRDDIAAFLGRHHRVYVKPHPYARQTVRILAFLRALARNADRIRVTEENLYALLSNSNVTEVCGISSCAVYQADYFGKAVTYLSNSRLTLCAPDDAFDPIRFVPVYDAFLNPGFWRRVLAGVCPVAAGRDIELPRKTSRLRNNLSLYWGYGHLDWEIPLRTIGLHPAPAPTQPAMSAWENHDEGLLLQEAGRHEAAVECFAAALAEDESAERWHDWAAAQLAAGRPREAGDGRLMAARADARHTAAGRGFEAVARSGTVLVRSAHGTGTETIGNGGSIALPPRASRVVRRDRRSLVDTPASRRARRRRRGVGGGVRRRRRDPGARNCPGRCRWSRTCGSAIGWWRDCSPVTSRESRVSTPGPPIGRHRMTR